MSEETEQSRYLMIGLLNPVLQRTLFSPCKRVYNLVQVQGELVSQGRIREPYKGYVDCTKQSYSAGGLTSFWRGNILGSIVSIPETVVRYATTKSFFRPSDGHFFKLKDIWFGGVVSSVYLIIFYPLEYASFRLLSDVKQGKDDEYQFKGIIDVYRKTWTTDGIVGIYRGLGISVLGIFAYRCLVMAFKSILKSMSKERNGKFFITVFSTIMAGILTYPLDTIRKRLMMTSGADKKYNGTIDCLKQIVENEGFLSLYNGIALRMLEGVVGGAFSIFITQKLRSLVTS